jgi:hypothetical protein
MTQPLATSVPPAAVRPAEGTELQMGATEVSESIVDFGWPLREELSADLAAQQASMVPQSHHGHPEFGMRASSDPPATFELVQMRNNRSRFLFEVETGNIIEMAGQAEVFHSVDGWMVSRMPTFVTSGSGFEAQSPTWAATFSGDWSEGIRLSDARYPGVTVDVLGAASLSSVTGDRRVELGLPSGQWTTFDHRRVALGNEDLRVLLGASVPGIAYEMEFGSEWVKAAAAGADTVELSQSLLLPAGWTAILPRTERQPGMTIDEEWVETCSPIILRGPGDASVRISPPSLMDQTSEFARSRVRPLGLGCGQQIAHHARVKEGQFELVAVMDAAWMRSETRSYPLVFDPIWEFTRQQRLGGAAPNTTFSTLVGFLDDRVNANGPSASLYGGVFYYYSYGGWEYYEYVDDFSGLMGAGGVIRGRMHYDLTGLDGFATTVPGGANASGDYFPVTIGYSMMAGPYFRASTSYGRPTGCSSWINSNDTRKFWQFQVTWQDLRCVTGPGSNTDCNFSNLWDGVTTEPRLRGNSVLNFTSPVPAAGWNSPIRTGLNYTESGTCGDAGSAMNSACRAFSPPANSVLTIDGAISSAGDVDHYGLFLAEPINPAFTLTVTNATGGCNFDAVVELWTNSGGEQRRFASMDDVTDPVTGTVNDCPTLTLGGLPSGAYSVGVSGFTGADVGSYRLRISYENIGDRRFRDFSSWFINGPVAVGNDRLGPNGTSNLFLSTSPQHDYGSRSVNDGTCATWDVGMIANVNNRFGYNQYAMITYVGRITSSPTNLSGRALTRNECQAVGSAEGCGILWTWSPAPKARWYNLLDGAGLIEDILELFRSESNLSENTRYTRRIEGDNEFAAGPASVNSSAVTMVRTPSTSDFSISSPVVGTGRVSATAPPNLGTGAFTNCTTGNCTGIRYQARVCDAVPTGCTTSAQCGSVAGQPGACDVGLCVGDTNWTRSTSADFTTGAVPCYEFRIRYQNLEGVQSENWSPWIRQTFVTLLPPTMAAPTCADMGVGSIRWRWTDQSVGEDGFRLLADAATTTAFATIASTSSGSTGTEYFRLIEGISGAAGNTVLSAVARSYAQPALVRYDSSPSGLATAHTLSRAPRSSELRVDAIRSRGVDLTVVEQEQSPCIGRSGARVQRCLANGTGCVTLSDFSLASPFAGCAGRGYGSAWEFNGGTIAGVGDGQLFDTGLQPSTAYEYRFWYYNASGCLSATYLSRQVTTLPEGPCCFDPAAPVNIASSNCTGVCAQGTIVCNGTLASTCFCQAPGTYSPTETCDNRDNNCDGAVDGITQLLQPQSGACAGNRELCTAGVWNPAPGNYTPGPETCNGVDDDCDGLRDEDSSGAPLTETCYTGAAGTAGVGPCRSGTRACVSSAWGTCAGQVVPVAEQCNLVDDDCDGGVDEALESTFCLGGADGCDGVTPIAPSEPRDCVDGCRIGNAVCENGALFCDITATGGDVLDGDTVITDVLQGTDVDVSACENDYADFVCGATTMAQFEIANNGSIALGADTVVEFWLDYDTAAEVRVAGPFSLGSVVAVDAIQSFSFCWLNNVIARVGEGRSLQVVISHPADPDSCIVSDRFSERVPADLGGIEPETCDGQDNDCNGEGDVRQSADACGNSVGDSTLSCRDTQFGGWMCVAE